MGSQTLWSAGRYESVGERVIPMATYTVAAADRRHRLRDAQVVDLGCGTGGATLAAAELGAHVTGVDLAPELIAVGAKKAAAAGHAVTWATADACDTGLPAEFADAVVSNLGIIFVAPDRQLTEIRRLLKSDGVLSFSSWVRATTNPLFDPVIAVLGTPPARNFSPDQWGDPQVINARLSPHFDGIEIENGTHTWTFRSMSDALRFVSSESPLHVDIFARTDDAQRDRLLAAFEAALLPHLNDEGIAFDVPYVVVTALRR